MEFEVIEAAISNKTVLRRLMELYLYEFSEMEGTDVDDHGLYGYRYLDHYWTEPDRYPFLCRIDGRWAGFALVRRMSYFDEVDELAHAFAEFFVMRRYRLRGVGKRMATELFRRFPGRWEIAEIPQNVGAQAFWRRVIDDFAGGNFEEHALDDERWQGPIQVFRTP